MAPDPIKPRTNPDGGRDGAGTITPVLTAYNPITNVSIDDPTFFQRAWLWLDSRKTVLSLIGMGIGKLLTLLNPAVGAGVFYLASAAAVGAAGHKVAKGIKGARNKQGDGKTHWLDILAVILLEIIEMLKHTKRTVKKAVQKGVV